MGIADAPAKLAAHFADIPLIVQPSGMVEREEKVWISSDGLHRVAAVERPDGHFFGLLMVPFVR